MLREEFLHYLRIREWQDLHAQLRQAARNAGLTLNDVAADPDRIHIAVLSGLLSQVGLREERDQGVPRRPRRQVHDLPRLAAGEEAAALGDGRRAGGDLPAVRAHRRPDRAGVDRAARRAPGQAHLLGAALVAQARGRRRHRARHAARHPDRRRPQRRPRPHRPGDRTRAVHPARARRGRLGHPPPLLPRQPGAARGRRGAGAPGAAARPRRRRGDARRVLRGARSRSDVVSGRHFDSWWKKESRRPPGAARLHRGDAAHRAGRRRRPHRLPRPRRGGRAHAAAVVRVRAGRALRRRHGGRAGGRAAPGRPHSVHLAGAGPARGAGHGPDPHAAQAAPAAVRARARPRPRGARPPAGRRANRCSTGWSASWAGCAASTSRARRGSSTGCPST